MIASKLSECVVHWRLEERAAILQITGDLSLGDARCINDQIIAWLDQARTPSYLIIDARQLMRPPLDLRALNSITTFRFHKNLRCVVVISTGRSLVDLVASHLMRRSGFTHFRARTLADAFEMLSGLDPSFSPLTTQRPARLGNGSA